MMEGTVGIVGYGYVGKAMHRIFPDAWINDPYVEGELISDRPKGYKQLLKSFVDKEGINACEMVIVCVPTPIGPDGWTCDTSIVKEVCSWLKVPIVLIKSTVVPGTTDEIQSRYSHGGVCFSPEYVGEGTYFTPPWKYPDPVNTVTHGFMTIGGIQKYCDRVYDFFIKKMGVHTRFNITDAKTAEAVKYFSNVWGAMKVAWANEMFEACKAMGLDYRIVRDHWLDDPRSEAMHTAVFGKSRGFGGKCLPKDLRAFIAHSEAAGYEPKLLKQVVKVNNEIRERHGQSEV